jgi:hypothetical protein
MAKIYYSITVGSHGWSNKKSLITRSLEESVCWCPVLSPRGHAALHMTCSWHVHCVSAQGSLFGTQGPMVIFEAGHSLPSQVPGSQKESRVYHVPRRLGVAVEQPYQLAKKEALAKPHSQMPVKSQPHKDSLFKLRPAWLTLPCMWWPQGLMVHKLIVAKAAC